MTEKMMDDKPENPMAGEAMTLRDYFAAKALQGFLANGTEGNWGEFAFMAYNAAEAMLQERELRK